MPSGMLDLPQTTVLAACLTAAVIDVRSYRVPNVLTGPLLAGGLVLGTATGGAAGLGAALLGSAAAFLALIAFHAMGVMGAGDVKLGVAVGAWLGAAAVLRALLVTALAGGGYVLALRFVTGGAAGLLGTLYLAARDPLALLPSPAGGQVLARRLAAGDRRRHLVPFAALFALGVGAVALGA